MFKSINIIDYIYKNFDMLYSLKIKNLINVVKRIFNRYKERDYNKEPLYKNTIFIYLNIIVFRSFYVSWKYNLLKYTF